MPLFITLENEKENAVICIKDYLLVFVIPYFIEIFSVFVI